MRRLQVAESAEPAQLGTDDAADPHGGNGDSSMQEDVADVAPTPDSESTPAHPPRTPAPAVTPPVEPAAATGACTGTSA